jgi:hypothetical protein
MKNKIQLFIYIGTIARRKPVMTEIINNKTEHAGSTGSNLFHL